MQINDRYRLSIADVDRIIEMAWEDRTPFGAIDIQFGLSEAAVIQLMRQELRPSGFRMWRKRVQGRSTKHAQKRSFATGKHKSPQQRVISWNKLSKRY